MGSQKQAVMDLIERHHSEGRTVGEVFGSLGVPDRVITGGEGPRGENGAVAELVDGKAEAVLQ